MTFQNFNQWLEGAAKALDGYELIFRINKEGEEHTLTVTMKSKGKSPELMPQVFRGTREEIANVLSGAGQDLPKNVVDLGERYAQWKEAFDKGAETTSEKAEAPAKRGRKPAATTQQAELPTGLSEERLKVLAASIKNGISTVEELIKENPALTETQITELRKVTPAAPPAETSAPTPQPEPEMNLDLDLDAPKTNDQKLNELLDNIEKAWDAKDKATVAKLWPEVKPLRQEPGIGDKTLDRVMKVYQKLTGKSA